MRDFLETNKYVFPPKGSGTTPPHSLAHTFKPLQCQYINFDPRHDLTIGSRTMPLLPLRESGIFSAWRSLITLPPSVEPSTSLTSSLTASPNNTSFTPTMVSISSRRRRGMRSTSSAECTACVEVKIDVVMSSQCEHATHRLPSYYAHLRAHPG